MEVIDSINEFAIELKCNRYLKSLHYLIVYILQSHLYSINISIDYLRKIKQVLHTLFLSYSYITK